MKKFTVKAKVGVSRQPIKRLDYQKIQPEFLLQDENGDYSLMSEVTLAKSMLKNSLSVVNARILNSKIDVVGATVPLVFRDDFPSSLSNSGEISQMTQKETENIRTVKAVVREVESHVSGYLLDNDIFIDIYNDKQFFYSYTNAVMDEKGILRVKHEEDLPDKEVDSIRLSHGNPDRISNFIENTGSNSRLKFYRDPPKGVETYRAMAAVIGEEWYTAPPLHFYHYVPARIVKNGKVTTGLRCKLTAEGKDWIGKKDSYFPIPKPLSALDGIPVIHFENMFQGLGSISNLSLQLWDEDQIQQVSTRKGNGRWRNNRHRSSSTVMMGGGRFSLSGDDESPY